MTIVFACWGLVRGYQLLVGAAFENYLKAIAVARGHIEMDRGVVRFQGVQGATNHRLPDLAASLKLALGPEEQDLLARTSAYLRWASRYPVPRRAAETDSDRELLSWSQRDPSLARALSERLKSEARRSTENET